MLINLIFKRNIRFYHKNVLDHYYNPRNIGKLESSNTDIGTGIVGAPACGDVMKFQIKVKDNIIIDTKFKTFGCGSAIASSSYGSEYIKGKTLEEANSFSNKEISQYLKLPPVKLHCSMLMVDAIKSDIKDYKNKN